MDSFESEKISFKSWDVMGLFEALKFMKLKGGSHGGENWRVSVFWVFLRVAQSRWLVGWKPNSNCSEQICHCSPAVCKAVQCEGSGRGINGTISVSGTETGWRGRQSFNPARNDTKWLPLAALPRESSDRARLIYTRNATKPLLFCSQICHFMRLALQKWPHFHSLSFITKLKKGFNIEGRILRSARTS